MRPGVMKFWIKLAICIVSVEIVLFLAVGAILAAGLRSGQWEALLPVYTQAGIAAIVIGVLTAFVIGIVIKREIYLRTGTMQEMWDQSLTIFQAIPAGIVIIDPVTHSIVDANRAALKAFGAPKYRVRGKVCHQYLCPAEEGYCPITDLGQRRDASERVLVTAKGKSIPVFKYVVPIEYNKRLHLLEVFFDIKERKVREQGIKEAYRRQENVANYDQLTGVLNRRAITRHAEAELNRAERGSNMSLALFDIDHFKKINDTHGHLVGDDVLRHIADTIMKYVRPYDWVGRWGGEEFLVLLPDSSIHEAAEIAERLRQAINQADLSLPGGIKLRISASAGISGTSMLNRKSVRLETLIKRADEALYRAKTEGRNRVCVAGNI